MIKNIFSSFFTRILSFFCDVFLFIFKYLGAKGRGKITLLRTSTNFISLINRFIVCTNLVYLILKHTSKKFLILTIQYTFHTVLVIIEPYYLSIIGKHKDKLIFKRKKSFKPISKFFYSLFYLNEHRYGHTTLKSNSKILHLLKFFLNHIWKYLPGTYVKYEWNGEIKYEIKK